MCVQVPVGARKGHQISVSGATGSCELPSGVLSPKRRDTVWIQASLLGVAILCPPQPSIGMAGVTPTAQLEARGIHKNTSVYLHRRG